MRPLANVELEMPMYAAASFVRILAALIDVAFLSFLSGFDVRDMSS